jgi:hypothetical protein
VRTPGFAPRDRGPGGESCRGRCLTSPRTRLGVSDGAAKALATGYLRMSRHLLVAPQPSLPPQCGSLDLRLSRRCLVEHVGSQRRHLPELKSDLSGARMTIAQRVLDFIRSNPGRKAREIAKALSLEQRAVSSTLHGELRSQAKAPEPLSLMGSLVDSGGIRSLSCGD